MKNLQGKKLLFSYRTIREIYGYLFISPFIIGFFLFFLIPFVRSIIFSFSHLQIVAGGYELEFIGLANYRHVLTVNPNFNPALVSSFAQVALQLPVIIIFSYFVAVIINTKFKGRFLARSIFFLPVITAAGVFPILGTDELLQQAMTGVSDMVAQTTMLISPGILNFLYGLELPEQFLEYVIQAAESTPQIIESAAIPILIFLAGLQSIPASLYEVADIDGATGWEKFWKVTFPLLSPMLLVNVVFIIVDSFASMDNQMIRMIQDNMLGRAGFGISSSMIWIYFSVIIVFMIIVVKIVSQRVIYME